MRTVLARRAQLTDSGAAPVGDGVSERQTGMKLSHQKN